MDIVSNNTLWLHTIMVTYYYVNTTENKERSTLCFEHNYSKYTITISISSLKKHKHTWKQ